MYSIKNYIGQEVRRYIFMLRKTEGTYHHLFSVTEHLEEEMQDADSFPPNKNGRFIDFDKDADGSKEKIFMVVDRVRLTEDMVYRPWDSMTVGKDRIRVDGRYEWWAGNAGAAKMVPLHHEEQDELHTLLPKRHCSAFVNYCKAKETDETVVRAFRQERLRKQLEKLSVKNLGYNLTQHTSFGGACIFVAYNPIYTHIDFTEDDDSPGIYWRVNYREGRHDTLSLAVRGLDKDNHPLFNKQMYTEEGIFLYHEPFEQPFHHLDIVVFDGHGTEIDNYSYVIFVHTFSLSMQIKSKDMAIVDNSGKTVKRIEKFVEEKPVVIGQKEQTDSLWDTSDEYSYEKLETALDFVFFEGGKEPEIQKRNKEKAKKYIMKILDGAHNICYLCDPYFDAEAFRTFIWEMKSLSVEIRIISSKADLSAGQKRELAHLVKEYNEKVGGKVQCRLLRGEESILHDRFIVTDDKVWMLGCSLNKFAEKATTLIRVPRTYRKKLIETAGKWWNNEIYTEAL
ncbi:MAG: phospholipase D family protein [Paraprevotella sp.]|nr:phospholipase D family protein [Paraprevotella sp.]